MSFFHLVKEGFNNAYNFLAMQKEIRRSVLRNWSGKAIKAEVENPKQFFNKKRLRRKNADMIHKGFRIKIVDGGAILTRRAINLSPEECARLFTESFKEEPITFRVVRW